MSKNKAKHRTMYIVISNNSTIFQACGVEKVLNEFGEHVFNLGCLSKKTCSQNATEGITSTSTSCTECCESTNLCNSQGCGEQGYPQVRGPICYNCPIHKGGGQCHDIEFCADNEVCIVVGKIMFTDIVYSSKCITKHGCTPANETLVAIVGKRGVNVVKRTHELHTCDTCCATDLCNRDCNSVRPVLGTATDCYDLYHKFNVTEDGIYEVATWKTHEKIKVVCDMNTNGGGWTIFQNRFDGSLNFTKAFKEYENGFGDLHGEFWMGLKYIHEMTAFPSELRIDLTATNGTMAYENFQHFSVGPGSNYTLHISPGTGTSGDDGNGLSYHNNMHFTTFDHDNDKNDNGNCASVDNGGFWFKKCYVANLNGSFNTTLYYKDFARHLKATKMMFRKTSA